MGKDSPLANKPSHTDDNSWLADIARSANQNPHLSEKLLTIDGNAAFDVRYRTAEGNLMEEVYTVFGSRTFSIEFSGDNTDRSIEKSGNYPVFQEMTESFRVQDK